MTLRFWAGRAVNNNNLVRDRYVQWADLRAEFLLLV